MNSLAFLFAIIGFGVAAWWWLQNEMRGRDGEIGFLRVKSDKAPPPEKPDPTLGDRVAARARAAAAAAGPAEKHRKKTGPSYRSKKADGVE